MMSERYEYGRSDPALRPTVPPPGRRSRDMVVDGWGNIIGNTTDVSDMLAPVRCRCGAVYDTGTVTVTARYADCSMWVTPCCRITVDDRPPWPGGLRAFTRLDKDGRPRA
jgi:hypothetical protein